MIDCNRYTEAYVKSLFNLKYNATDDDVDVELDDCEVDFFDSCANIWSYYKHSRFIVI